MFVKLCSISYYSPSLTARCAQTIQTLPCLDAWFIDYVTVALFESCVINSSEVRRLRILEPNADYDEADLDSSDWCEMASAPWLHAWGIMRAKRKSHSLEQRVEVNEAYGDLMARKAEGCGCEPVSFLSPDIASGEWLDCFNATT